MEKFGDVAAKVINISTGEVVDIFYFGDSYIKKIFKEEKLLSWYWSHLILLKIIL